MPNSEDIIFLDEFMEPGCLWSCSFLVLLCNELGPAKNVSVDLVSHCFIVIKLSVFLILYQCVSPTWIEHDSNKSIVFSLQIQINITIILQKKQSRVIFSGKKNNLFKAVLS